jgi:hypothetical protein
LNSPSNTAAIFDAMAPDIGDRAATAIGSVRMDALVAVLVYGGCGLHAEADIFLYGSAWQFE